MIVREDSALRRLPADLERRVVLFFDGIRYAVEMADLAYGRLRNGAIEISKARVEGAQAIPQAMFPAMFLDAFSIVDSINRLRVLLTDMPELRREPHIRAFLGKTRGFQELRHGVQHLDDRIRELVVQGQPAWGSLSWFCLFDPSQRVGWCHALWPGTMIATEQRLVNPLGHNIRLPVDLIEVAAFGLSVSLSDGIAAVERVARVVEEAIRTRYGTASHSGSDVWLSLEVAFDVEPASEHEVAVSPGESLSIRSEKEKMFRANPTGELPSAPKDQCALEDRQPEEA